MKEGFLKLFVFLMTVLLGTVMISLYALSFGLMLHFFWGWFIVPLFGLPAFPILLATGTAVLIRTVVGASPLDIGPSDKAVISFRIQETEHISQFWHFAGKSIELYFHKAVIENGCIILFGWFIHLLI